MTPPQVQFTLYPLTGGRWMVAWIAGSALNGDLMVAHRSFDSQGEAYEYVTEVTLTFQPGFYRV